MSSFQEEIKEQSKLDKNLALVKLFFQVLIILVAEIFLGTIITMMAIFGIDVSLNESFLVSGGSVAGKICIPLFALALFCALVIGAIQLRDVSLKEEDQLSEFKLVKEELDK